MTHLLFELSMQPVNIQKRLSRDSCTVTFPNFDQTIEMRLYFVFYWSWNLYMFICKILADNKVRFKFFYDESSINSFQNSFETKKLLFYRFPQPTQWYRWRF